MAKGSDGRRCTSHTSTRSSMHAVLADGNDCVLCGLGYTMDGTTVALSNDGTIMVIGYNAVQGLETESGRCMVTAH